VLPRRYARPDESSAFTDSERHLILAAETLRNGDTAPKRVKDGDKADERISVFWRVFGGTILSITALMVINAYQTLANGIHEVRTDVGRLRETSANYTQKDEFNTRTTKLWEGVRAGESVGASVTVLTSKVTTLEGQLAAAEHERREMCRELLALRERLAKLEGQQEIKPAVKSAAHTEPAKRSDGP
jgi:hypothetical protein